MNWRTAAVIALIAWALGSALTTLAQARPHDDVMREVAAEFAALGENLEAAALSDAGDNAARLQSLFVEIEAFWSVFETQDATDLARSAQEGAGTVIDAADEDDAEAAEAGLDAIQRTCGTCHNAHREAMPDGSFRIKP